MLTHLRISDLEHETSYIIQLPTDELVNACASIDNCGDVDNVKKVIEELLLRNGKKIEDDGRECEVELVIY